ncbi:hypothetical protein HAX54_027927 [Datura stramonium]|uniref:Phytocyanin domain-containing protein n=1 Tax=Datura stramonium TaxID=4076 RepID=A0ABS8S952_DATST|nr:hypothetical protein [Datura stramonium]
MAFFGKAMLVVIMAALGSTMATVYEVGDSVGWTFNYNYDTWTFFRKFQFGDTLVFNYNPQLHNVRQVDIKDYNSCTDNNPIASFNSGSDSITLDIPGDYYFLCGVPGHCASGLKFHLKIAAPSTTNTRYPDHFPSSSASVAYSSKWFPMSMLFS